MNVSNSLGLFGVLLALAVMPSASVALVLARSSIHGFNDGLAVSVGIVLGDLIFMALALLGMGFLAETLGTYFTFIKCLGGGYLIWQGSVLLLGRNPAKPAPANRGTASLISSFCAGLLLTLGDVKAIFFYASLLPAFVELQQLKTGEIVLITVMTMMSVGGVKAGYAFAGDRLQQRFQLLQIQREARLVGGFVLVGAGSSLLIQTFP